MASGIKKTDSEFREELIQINPDIIPLESYINNNTKMLCRCKKCSYEWKTRPHDLLRGHGCPKCSYRERGENRRKDNEKFMHDLSFVNPDVSPLEQYITSKKKISFKCLNCNYVWKTSPHSILAGSGCPKCARRRQGRAEITETQFSNRLKQTHPSILIISPYQGYNKRTKFKCTNCGYEWDDMPMMLLFHQGCPECVKKKTLLKIRKTHEQFCEELKKSKPEIEVLGKYITSHKKIEFMCKICGHQWEAKPNSILSGTGCPHCAHAGTSYIEQLIYLSFASILGQENVKSRDRKLVGKELDVFIPKYNLAIEYGSWLWHKEHLATDNEKSELCKAKGIRLIRIYDACKGDDSAMGEDVFLFDKAISVMHNEEYSFICWLFDVCGFESSSIFTETRFIELQHEAYKRSRKKTTKSFQEELQRINPNIMVIGEYQRDDIHIKVKCKKCGNEWSASPSNLLQGCGCPKCSRKHIRTKEEFLSEMYQLHPHIIVIGEYKNGSTYITCKCKKCGYEWKSKPNWLITQKHGCPNCSGRRRLTHQEFVDRLNYINPNIQVIGTYKNYETNIECRCIVCNNIWNPRPHNLLQGSGCPVCKKRKTKNTTV